MNLIDTYTMAFWGLLVALITLQVQWFVASGSKAKQPGAIPGKIDESLGHSSFVFRAHRTYLNSLENFPAMLGTSLLAILIGANALWTGLLIWLYALARIGHMALYYGISTDRNPSPRTWFFMLGWVANIALLVFCVIALV
jgi:uncharacterized MAPEG superfamily protein